jgi:hypothetical protein
LERQVSGRTCRTADSAEPHEARNTVPLSPMAVELSANTNNMDQVGVNTACACLSSCCKVCKRNGVNANNVAVTEMHTHLLVVM